MILISVHAPSTVTVDYRPSVIRWLLGERPRTSYAYRVGERQWVDGSNRAYAEHVVNQIESAVAQIPWSP